MFNTVSADDKNYVFTSYINGDAMEKGMDVANDLVFKGGMAIANKK